MLKVQQIAPAVIEISMALGVSKSHMDDISRSQASGGEVKVRPVKGCQTQLL